MYMIAIISVVKVFLYKAWEKDVLKSIRPDIDTKSV